MWAAVPSCFPRLSRTPTRHMPWRLGHSSSFEQIVSIKSAGLMIKLLANQRRNPQATGRTDINRLLQQQPAPQRENSALFEQEYNRQLFHWAADRIRGEFRNSTWEAFWLTAVDGKQIKEVAPQLGLTVGAVYKARSHVMARLRETIQRLEDK